MLHDPLSATLAAAHEPEGEHTDEGKDEADESRENHGLNGTGKNSEEVREGATARGTDAIGSLCEVFGSLLAISIECIIGGGARLEVA